MRAVPPCIRLGLEAQPFAFRAPWACFLGDHLPAPPPREAYAASCSSCLMGRTNTPSPSLLVGTAPKEGPKFLGQARRARLALHLPPPLLPCVVYHLRQGPLFSDAPCGKALGPATLYLRLGAKPGPLPPAPSGQASQSP